MRFCKSENVLSVHSHLSSNLAGCRILDWKLFSLILKALFDILLASIVSVEKFLYEVLFFLHFPSLEASVSFSLILAWVVAWFFFHHCTSPSVDPFIYGLQFWSSFFFKIHSLIHSFINLLLRWVFVAARRLSLVAASGGYSLLRCAGFSLQWLLLLRSMGSRHAGFSSCGMRAQ